MLLQVLVISQGEQRLGFSYGLPMTKKPYGERSLDQYVTPLLGGEARVLHERLREDRERNQAS